MSRPWPCRIMVGISLVLYCMAAQAQGKTAARINYIMHCQGCHLADGSATPGKVPALKQDVGRFLQVEGGREFLIQVPGTSQSALTDAEVADVLNWILKNFSGDELPYDFTPYTTLEITQFRQPLTNVGDVRAGLVAQFETGRPTAIPE